ncbi:MAG TPA: DegT/DnrJ/EryC1/StrS family aminotransferase [Candidatus Eisenbacteria bacterium]|nr:DegT/DnrJ/EryC1/StrS family aminotransferase [Candidatus Eisenbacteria bacterium]
MSAAILTVAPPLPWNVYVRRCTTALPFPFKNGLGKLFARARQGLYEGLLLLRLPRGAKALVPAFHHGSEIEAYVQAGLDLLYYDVGPDLAPDPAELDARLDPSVRVLHVIHYLGFAQDAARWRHWCDLRGIHLVEDAAQGWLGAIDGRPLGTWGTLALFSIYKTVGVPDGGAVVLEGTLLRPTGRHHMGVRGVAVRHGAWFAARSPAVGSLWRRLRRAQAYLAEKDFRLGDPRRGATAPLSILLPRLLASPVAEARARHYRALTAELRAWVPRPFRRDPEGLSPFAFPVFVVDKERAAAGLMRHGVRAVKLWSVPHPSLRVTEFPGAARLRQGTLLLPVHQELRPEDLERIVSAAYATLGPPVPSDP